MNCFCFLTFILIFAHIAVTLDENNFNNKTDEYLSFSEDTEEYETSEEIDEQNEVSGRATETECKNEMSNIVIEGVTDETGANDSKTVMIKGNIFVSAWMISKDGTVILLDIPADESKRGDVKSTDANLLLTENAVLFTANAYYYKLRVGNPAKMLYILGGWNQIFLGCPQPVCIDGRFDAMLSNESNVILAFRGKYFWKIAADGNGKTPTVQNAMLIRKYFPSIDTYLTAATSDQFANLYLFDVNFQVHAYMKDMDSLAESLLPGIKDLVVVTPVWDYMKTKLFRRKPFYMKKLSNSAYSLFAPIDWRVYYPHENSKNKDMQIDAAFFTKGEYEKQGFRFWVFNTDKYMVFDFQKVARYALRKTAENTKVGHNDLMTYTNKVDSPVTKQTDYFIGPDPVNNLNKDFPVELESAYDTIDGEVAFSKNWDFYLMDEEWYDIKNLSQLQSNEMTPIDDVYISLLNCKRNKYPSLGFESYDKFIEKYKSMLTPKFDPDGSVDAAPLLGISELPTHPITLARRVNNVGRNTVSQAKSKHHKC
ncbi:hypothetical protein B4U80_13731 [Leptotrombidium deliense]|uniref:Uncharacterized protein n=1 Tax=Leptotrombidium deliense TaxID=299467 RepID=A0A443SI03_9ACAR|nr:hypothetical protein B4U80_13731 [Leptotrombidium deliense]